MFLGGWSGSNISCEKNENNIGSEDFWIIKLAPDSITGHAQIQDHKPNIEVGPNPSNGKFTISMSGNNHPRTISISNVTGNIIYEKAWLIGDEIEIDLIGNTTGIYFVKIIEFDFSSVEKVLLY